MIDPTIIFITILAVLNATVPGQTIPIEVTTRLAEDSSSEAAIAEPVQPQPLIDAALVTTVIGLATSVFAGYKKNSTKVDAVADTTVNLKESVKASDYGNKDTAQIVANIANKLKDVKSIEDIPKALEQCAPAALENAKAWNQDVKEYYEIKPPVTSEDVGLDKTRQKLVQVNKETKKTPEP